MVQVIEGGSNWASLLGGVAKTAPQGIALGLQNRKKKEATEREDKTLQNLLGKDLSGLSPEIKKSIVDKLLLSEGKQEENRKPLEAGLKTLQRQRELLKQGHLGLGSSFFDSLSSEGRRARSEYQQLGKSMIQLASNIPIRNQMEFETLSKKLYDTNISEADIEGVLDAMERIISQSLGSEIEEPEDKGGFFQPFKSKKSIKNRPPLQSFHR